MVVPPRFSGGSALRVSLTEKLARRAPSCILIALLLYGTATARARSGANPFVVEQSANQTKVACPGDQVSVEFISSAGQFILSGPGCEVLQAADLRFRSGGHVYTFPTGLVVDKVQVQSGKSGPGPFTEVSVDWHALDARHTVVQTNARLYAGFPTIVFDLSFPKGAANVNGRSFEDVGCAFPAFQAPKASPTGLHWLSYTYQDWPIPIRGSGWPRMLAPLDWPASGTDDTVRTPLVLFTPDHHSAVLSPLDNPLQQLVVLGESNPTATTPGSTRAGAPPLGPIPLLGPTAAPTTAPNGTAGNRSPISYVGGPAVQLAAYRTRSPRRRIAAQSENVEPGLAVLVGPEGNLQDLPPGASFHSVLSFGHVDVVDSILAWGAFMQLYNGKHAQPAPDDFTARTLGYWTDNGSAYYYRTEGNANYQAMMAAVKAYHVQNHIPVRYYQLDSWWYAKGADGGTTLWQPNLLALPDGASGILHALGTPLALHNRYWSARTPYLAGGGFSVGAGGSVPLAESFYDDMFHTVRAWDCRLYEQDWLAPQFRRVASLQTHYGAPDQWLKAMDTASEHWDLPIQFCMPSMGFYLAASGLPGVTQIRTSQDFDRRDWDSVRLRWMEHGQLSLMATALGMVPSKDVLLTTRQGQLHAAAWERVEALLAILSRGPVGIGDPFGYTDTDLVAQLCTEDGDLVQPDRPAYPVNACVTGQAQRDGLPMVLHTVSTIGDRIWHYILSLDLSPKQLSNIGFTRPADDAQAPAGASTAISDPAMQASTALIGDMQSPYVLYDYLHNKVVGVTEPGQPLDLPQPDQSVSYSILAPLLPDGTALIGDVSKFVTTSSSRFKEISWHNGTIDAVMEGPPGSQVRLAIYDPGHQPTCTVDGVVIYADASVDGSDSAPNALLAPAANPGNPPPADPPLRALPRPPSAITQGQSPETGQQHVGAPVRSALYGFSFTLPAGTAPHDCHVQVKTS